MGVPPVLARTREEAGLAVRCISRELVWKIHFEKAQVTYPSSLSSLPSYVIAVEL